MRTQRIGQTDLVSTRLVYGVMRVAGAAGREVLEPQRRQVGRDVIIAAYEAGLTHFDSADIYGNGLCDKILGDALAAVPGMRERVIVTTKCGIRRLGEPRVGSSEWYDASADYIVRSAERALNRLRIDAIDIFLLHRPDVLMEPDEVAGAFDRLRDAGKVRYFGVSNFLPSQLKLLRKSLTVPIAMNQVQMHPGHVDPIYDGTLEQCMRYRITPEAYSPVGRGLYATGGAPPADHPKADRIARVLDVLDTVAAACGVSRTVVTLAWLLRHPAGILPVIGTVRPERIAEAVAADALALSRQQWHHITNAARTLA